VLLWPNQPSLQIGPTPSSRSCVSTEQLIARENLMTNQTSVFGVTNIFGLFHENVEGHLRPMLRMTLVAIPFTFLLYSGSVAAGVSEPVVKKLATAVDPVKNAVLVGRVASDGMVLQLELEGSEPMWMLMGNPPVWGAHQPVAEERYHVEVKITDPKTKTRIPYADITFAATLTETGKTMAMTLPPMWGSSGLHYSDNSALLGDGTYAATLTVGVPRFHRELKDKALWSSPVSAKFHFKLKAGKLTEVSKADR
jgi:Fe2+ transport protein